jgi:hypothetical protein
MRTTVGSVCLALSLALGGCGGGGGSSAMPAPAATASPAPAGTAGPTAAPVTPVATNRVVGAPAIVVGSSLLRKPLLSLGVNLIPTLVLGFSTTMGQDFSNVFAWVVTPLNVAVQEASATATVTGPMTLGHTVLDNVNLFASSVFDWIIEPQTVTGTGKILVNVCFGDGTCGSIPYYSYDRFNLQCGVSSPSNPTSWGYQGGVPVGQGSVVDVSADCVHNTVSFPNGAMLLDNPLADSYGNTAPQFTTVLSGSLNAAPLTLSSITVGAIYLVKLSDGGCAKVMWTQNNGNPALLTSGIAEHGIGSSCVFSF